MLVRNGTPLIQTSRLPALLLGCFSLIWLLLAIDPVYRQDWALENVLVVIAVPTLVRTHRRWPFSNAACIALFAFFTLHVIGAHYTYSEVPIDNWSRALFGESVRDAFGFSRNHYDRFVHFNYGLLLALPSIELLDRRAPAQGLWRWLLPILFISSHSVIYEMVEWFAASLFGGDLGTAYLGTQGDEWDAQKDMFLATLGAVIAVSSARLARRHVAA